MKRTKEEKPLIKKRILWYACGLFILALSLGLQTGEGLHAGTETDVIVVFKEQEKFSQEVQLQHNQEKILALEGNIEKTYENISAIAATLSVGEVLALKNDSSVQSVEQNRVVKPLVQSLDWGIAKVGADLGFATGYTGAGVKVAIVDSG